MPRTANEKILGILRKKIVSGGFDNVEFLPSERRLAEEYEFSGGAIKQIALKAAFEAAAAQSGITQEMLRRLCEFELGNNMVGFKRKQAAVGFDR